MDNNRSDEKPKEKDDNADIIQKSIGVLGPWHIWVCLLIFLCKFPVAWHQLNIVFEAPPTNFTCSDPSIGKCSENCPGHIFDRSIFEETIITQWDLVCERAYLANLAQSITMLGILVGNMLFGYFSDRFGRKAPLAWAIILQTITGIATAFLPWFPAFLLARFLVSVATGGTMVTSFVLVMELVGIKWRTSLGILYQIPFNVGHLLLPGFAYFIRDWKWLQFTISFPSILLISYYWLLPESPRWLITVGQVDKAVDVMEKAARRNNLPTAAIKSDVEKYAQSKSDSAAHQTGNFLDLFRTPVMRKYTICICYNWISCGLCFFGVAQYIGQLGGNIFLNVAFSAIIQLPSTLFAIWSLGAWGRKIPLIFGSVVAGASLLIISFLPPDPAWIRSTLSCLGMFGMALVFPTVYIYSGELFPTVVRNIGVGTSSMSARFGSMAAPFIATLASVSPWLPPVIFGVVPLVGALLCLYLPETLNCVLPNTIEEAEDFAKKGKPKESEAEMAVR